MNNDLKFSDVLQRLHAEYGDRAPAYRKLHSLVTEGRVPGYRHGGQWRFKETDLHAIRAGLGLAQTAEVSA